ncbi:MAG: putative signal protein with GGDEF domain [Halomonadaceae bacterium T82-2]|nr:MAG: putative signal protein with GGDEF domain [Halomonadaceae bacterium T82-2]
MLPDTLSQSLARCTALPSLPAVVMRVIEMAGDPEVSLRAVAATLSQDPALAARLLSLANTVLHVGRYPIEDVQQAVQRIGLDRTLSLALGCSLVCNPRDADEAPFLERYWQRALISAMVARSLAEALALESRSGSAFTAALLQDIGMLALQAALPETYRPLLGQTMPHARLVRAERELLGTDHAEVGAWLAQRWRLPERMVGWIRDSHAVLEPGAEGDRLALNCVIAAGRIADGWQQGEAELSGVMAALETGLGMEAPQMVEQLMMLQAQLPRLAALFRVGAPDALDAQQLMLEAKWLLAEQNARLQHDLHRQRAELEALRDQHQRLARQAHCDALTGLANRRQLEDSLNRAFDAASLDDTALTVVFIDLDRFKAFNDRHGHACGDEVLRRFGRLLAELVAQRGGEVGRYGGEEFLLILPGIDSQAAEEVVACFQSWLSRTPMAEVEGEALFVTASYGIATHCPGDQAFADVAALVHAADAGMYRAKGRGGSRVTIHEAGDPARQVSKRLN